MPDNYQLSTQINDLYQKTAKDVIDSLRRCPGLSDCFLSTPNT